MCILVILFIYTYVTQYNLFYPFICMNGSIHTQMVSGPLKQVSSLQMDIFVEKYNFLKTIFVSEKISVNVFHKKKIHSIYYYNAVFEWIYLFNL